MHKVDYLILGGGTAGCALAARLSEDANKTVLLVEAGRDLRIDAMPENIGSRYPGLAYLDKQNIWRSLTATVSGAPTSQPNRDPRGYEQARVLGGGSAINAMVANRGAPDDYDEWGRLGAEGWSGEVALHYFRKLERDCDFDDEYHGKAGPVPIRRLPPQRRSPFVNAVADTMRARGYPAHVDQNGKWTDGVFPTAIAVSDDGHRVPASIAYLTPEVRKRHNLTILTDTHVTKLLFEGARVAGAEVVAAKSSLTAASKAPQSLRAGETIVCSGGIHSAALLLRSGIGPADELKALGIRVHKDLRGVGKNLMEHPLIAVSAYLPARSRMEDLTEHHDQALLRYTSDMPGAAAGDMHIAVIGRTAWHAVGHRMGTLLVWVNKSYSRGSVTLRSADPFEEPEVDFRLLSDPRDLDRLKKGFRLAANVLRDPRLNRTRGTVFPTSYSERVKKVSAPGRWNAIQMAAFGKLLDWAGPARDLLIHRVVALGNRVDDLLADDSKLTEFVGNSVSGVWHASGTCKMGAAVDPTSVTDGVGRVHGIAGLRVCDSSIMPSIPRANTNLPTLMLAERLADAIKLDSARARTGIPAAAKPQLGGAEGVLRAGGLDAQPSPSVIAR
ncbi:GMC family oxidoreductase [Burkholderia cenocepacia]|uniref:Oxidoreductase n=1 Tax=Burkholderia cenocepacia (strain ATCC BAA-245 / DSM 16553 / LMG 16656 / NCTC 13227 / J2315 / CF5610) TaxID=216591 RepID=B4EDR6_BURCJ|nr:FAD-dependent oxidoreductase [Burkholderia cenocepacia]KIS47528.1 FAD dependent oxidoreductase family protein [Burkholderia cepacia]EPZ86760.1 GMC oxidoreductase [Burkholderia cenocepacia K56-2Valvano]ERI30707.1 GMC oxidoreductase [Burkholderia cenocepacia BC7]KKI79581.1 sorbosone dehydrogenase [Burkholderia cenocepacia]MCG0577505.1 GMC family oxidoreductase N-terminal domain-containing protein [Burkholderia cenocepacia]